MKRKLMLKILEEVSKDELKEVLHIFQKNKEPWFGWVPVEFFVGFYKVIEDDPMKVIKESISSRKMLIAFNATSIALIPNLDLIQHHWKSTKTFFYIISFIK
jgi:hypothetical protein